MIIGKSLTALGGGCLVANIFVKSLSETDTVTAINGSKIKAGVWTQIPNPACVTLPDGYTQLEYIESNGMQLIQLIGQNTGDFWYEII